MVFAETMWSPARVRSSTTYAMAAAPEETARAAVAPSSAAILASPDRTPGLRDVRVPTLVIHGADDPLVTVSGGRATAEAIPHAELVVIDGMGHDLPREVWPQLVHRIAALADRADGR